MFKHLLATVLFACAESLCKAQCAQPIHNSGDVDTCFNSGRGGFRNTVLDIAFQPDDKMLVSGDFSSYNSAPAYQVARLYLDGRHDATFLASALAPYRPGTGVKSMALQPDGKVVCGGYFRWLNRRYIGHIARLDSTGAEDVTFTTGIGFDSIVWSVALQPDGKILAGGAFKTFNGVPCNHIARLLPDGRLDTSFHTGLGIDSIVYKITLTDNGKIMVGGHFKHYNGVQRGSIARLNPDGTLDQTFAPPGAGIDRKVDRILQQPDGRLLVGGSFARYGGITHNNIVRVFPNGSVDTSFHSANGFYSVFGIALQSDGKIILGGQDMPGTFDKVARFNTDGSLDSSFHIAPTGFMAYSPITAVALHPSGGLYVGCVRYPSTNPNDTLYPALAHIFTDQLTATKPTVTSTTLRVYPNPTRGVLTFEGLPHSAPLTITDALGRTVLHTTATPAQPIALPSLAPGMYTWHASGQSGLVAVE